MLHIGVGLIACLSWSWQWQGWGRAGGWWLVCPFCAQEYKHTAVLVLVQCRPGLVFYKYKYLDMQNTTMLYQLSNSKVKSGLVDTIWQSFWPLGNLYRICNYVKLPLGNVSRIVQPPFINSCTVNKCIGSRATLFNYLPYFNLESLVDIFQEKIMHFKYHILFTLQVHSHSIA